MVQGETVAMPGWEDVGKPHCSDVNPIKKCGDEIHQDGKPVKNCASELQCFEKPVKNCARSVGEARITFLVNYGTSGSLQKNCSC